MRFFNTAGPMDPARHYCLPPLERLDLQRVLTLIDQQKYFVLHAPRQTGKTSSLLALRDHLNTDDEYRCVYTNVEVGQSARENVDAAIRAILGELSIQLRHLGEETLELPWWQLVEQHGGHGALKAALGCWAEQSERPVVVLIDEIDSLLGDTLIAVLRQLRAGYTDRPRHFPQSVVLCGVRDVRDYRIHSSAEKAIITGGSAFNIKAASLRLGDFDRDESDRLLQQHTAATGQVFESTALAKIWDLSQGQPWLTNALAYEVCFEMAAARNRQRTITPEMVDEAKETLILRRETHLDQLADKLREPRVQLVIAPLLEGSELPIDIPADDLDYVRDLGLIRAHGELAIANPIYREIIPRELTYTTERTIAQQTDWYVQTDGRLDMSALLAAFQAFFREHSEHWVERFQYREAGPQLLLQAFLQRIVNSGGRIEREYGLGRMRTDLLVLWPHPGGVQKVVIELKLLHKSLDRTVAEGLEQVWAYGDRCGAEERHLVVFDRRTGRSWEEKLFRRDEMVRGWGVMVWGM